MFVLETLETLNKGKNLTAKDKAKINREAKQKQQQQQQSTTVGASISSSSSQQATNASSSKKNRANKN